MHFSGALFCGTSLERASEVLSQNRVPNEPLGARYGYKNNPKDILEDAKKGCNGRYACVNITNWSTIEFRMFRGTLKYNTLIATLELVDSICDMALTYTDIEISKISWTDFVSSLDEETYSELITYLKERQLYVNAPIDTKEDN